MPLPDNDKPVTEKLRQIQRQTIINGALIAALLGMHLSKIF